MGQDVVYFIVDVLPTVGTGLKGQRGRKNRKFTSVYQKNRMKESECLGGRWEERDSESKTKQKKNNYHSWN